MLLNNLSFFENKIFNLKKRKLLLQYYKRVGLNENELVLVMLIMHFSFFNQQFVSPELISKYSSFSVDEIEKMLSHLQEREMINFEMQAHGLVMNLTLLWTKMLGFALEDEYCISNQYYLTLKDIFGERLTTAEKYQLCSMLSNVKDFQLIKDNWKKLPKNASYNEILEIVLNYFVIQKNDFTIIDWLDA